MSAKSSIQVCIKVRPCEPGLMTLWQVKDERVIQLIDSQADPCVFDHVFDQDANNQKVFDRMAKHIVQSCMQGFNGTIFAYGQTSSGKTYTMMGDDNNPGVMVLAAKEIFTHIASNNDRDFLLRVGYIEIYNEKIYDLLNKKNQDLKIHEAGNGIVNVNCEETIITSENDLLRLLCMGNKERTVGETNMNERSSRSHAIFRIIIESRKTDRSEEDAVIQSVLNLVDLAGSERADQTGARGARFKEGAHINKSLLFLSNVINNLAENEDNKFISFRDSKLTRILQASLVGNAFTSIICTIKPSICDESVSTLNFAMRAKKVRIKPQVNEMVSDATMMKRLEREIKKLKIRLAEEERKNESQLKVKQLEHKIKTDMLKIITSNSVNNDKRVQNRRRTWGHPGSSSSALTVTPLQGSQSKYSCLPKPSFYPTSHLNNRPDTGPKTEQILKSSDIEHIEDKVLFTDGKHPDNGLDPSDCSKTKVLGPCKPLPPIALTPNATHLGNVNKENLEKDLMELQVFTKLEKQFEGEWEKCRDLTEKLDAMTVQRDGLEAENLNCKQRCEALQDEITLLTSFNQTANKKIEDYEVEFKLLKQRIEELEMENRGAVSLEFEFKSHQNKSKLRENELLSVLTERDAAIVNLQRSLEELSRDVLRNSKEDQMRSMCPELETNCERICKNCQELERLLNESKTDNKTVESINCECEKLRLEIAETRTKLESIQIAFGEVTTEVAQKGELCVRLSHEIATAHDGMNLLQGKYNKLEQLCQSQQQALQDLQADYDVIQEKYIKLQEAYENLEQASSTSEEQCLQLQADNQRLQSEITSLKERVEEAQQKLLEGTSSEALELKYKAKTEELYAKLSEMEKSFTDIQNNYDCLSNELIESVQEGDDLRKQCQALEEELKQHQRQVQSGDAESMKSSGVGTECSEIEADLDSEILQQFTRLSESVHEIELQHMSGNNRVFRATKVEESTNVPALKLCLEYTQETDLVAHQFEDNVDNVTASGVYLKGVLKQHRFQIIRLNQKVVEDERLLQNHIIQLENEIAKKNALIDSTERTINDMREQMTILQSALLEKSVIVNKVEDYQRQIKSLEKQNAEMTMVYEELQVKVKENTLSDSFAMSLAGDISVNIASSPTPLMQDLDEIAVLKSTISNLKVTETQLLAHIEEHQKQIELKDETIRKLEADINHLNERCLSMDVLEVQLRSDIKEKQHLLERQTAKSVDDVQRIDQLQQLNAELIESSTNAEKLLTEMKERLQNAELYKTNCKQQDECAEQQLQKLEADLKKAQNDLQDMEKRKTDEITAMQLEFLDKIEVSESGYRTNLRKYNLEWEESKDRYESNICNLKESLSTAEDKLQNAIAQQQADLKQLKDEQKSELDHIIKEKHELESLYDGSQKMIEVLRAQHNSKDQDQVDAQKQLEQIKSLNNIIQDFEEKESKQLLVYEQLNNEYQKRLDELRLENQELQSKLRSVVAEKSEALQHFEKEMKSIVNEKEETLKKSLKLEQELNSALVENTLEKTEMQEKIKFLKAKIIDLENELRQAKQQDQQLEAVISEKEDALKKSLTLEQKLDSAIRENAYEKTAMMEKTEIYNAKLKDLEDELSLAKQHDHALQQIIAQKEEALKKSLQLEQQLDATIKEIAYEKTQMGKKIETFNGKLKDIEAELDEAKQKASSFDNLFTEHEQLKQLASDVTETKLKLEDKVKNLTIDLSEAQISITAHSIEINKLRSELVSAEDAKKSATEGQIILISRLEELETKMSGEARQLQRQVEELQGSLNELQIKLGSLHSSNLELETKNRSLENLLEEQRKTVISISDDNVKIKASNFKLIAELKDVNATATELKCRLAANTTEVNEKCVELRKELLVSQQTAKQLTEECEKLRSMLKAKGASLKADHQKDATINSLLDDNRDLGEKLCTANEIVAKLKSELSGYQKLKSNGSNMSMDSNASVTSPNAAVPAIRSSRPSLDRNPTLSRKSINFESELRNRRISAHDERRQSYFNDFKDAECMTDLVDSKCKCIVLEGELKEYQRNLFISESQVTALKIELKNHPLKFENAQLKQKLQEELERARHEVKRFKQKNQDLHSKINSLSASASKLVTSENVIVPARPEIVCKETQTESELEATLEIANAKLADALTICRSRHKQITDLEGKLKQNENNDTSNICSLTAGQIGALKAQCEAQKKELSVLHDKYELAKKALQVRKDELIELRMRISHYEGSEN